MRALTKPQLSILIDLYVAGEHGVRMHVGYKPARALVQLGYAVQGPSTFANACFTITDAGKAARAAARGAAAVELTPRQLSVLRLIREGEDGAFLVPSDVQVAQALERIGLVRVGLVSVLGQNARWHANATPDGLARLEQYDSNVMVKQAKSETP
jgi:hypothetical protein